jgi:hypothetical protein
MAPILSAERPLKNVPQSNMNNNVQRDHNNHLLSYMFTSMSQQFYKNKRKSVKGEANGAA